MTKYWMTAIAALCLSGFVGTASAQDKVTLRYGQIANSASVLTLSLVAIGIRPFGQSRGFDRFE